MSLSKEDSEYYEAQQLERDRRYDLECEREFWTGVMLEVLSKGGITVRIAVEQADEALQSYKERFQ